jgi:hypothetical protein
VKLTPAILERQRLCVGARHCAKVAVAICCCQAALGCAGGEALPSPPVAAVGQSVSAQQDFRQLEQAWLEGTDRERQDLEPRLTRFLNSFPTDPETRQVQVWLAWLRVSKSRFDEALALADKASADKVGTTADAAQVVKAAVFTRRGQPEQSLRLLEPLSGQIVDARERDSWAREIIRAALRLKHDDDALKWALVWRLESTEDRRAAIEREIGLVLDQVSRPALDRLWSQLVAADRIPTTSLGRKLGRSWMREAVLQRLTRFAIDKRDSALARRLLNDAWLPLQKHSSLKRLARVAAQGEVELQGLTRTIGVILELDDNRERRRSSDLLTGVLQALEEVAPTNNVRLRTREALLKDREGYADAVEDLYNEGVAIVVGGFEKASATELSKKARTIMIPAIALSRLEVSEQNESSFWIDTSEDTLVEAWHRAGSNKGSEADKVITDENLFCNTDAGAPFEEWRTAHIERVLLACDVSCAEKLGQAASNAAKLPAIWLGPQAVGAADSWRKEQIKGELTFEVLLKPQPSDESLKRWQARYLRLPSFYEVLGHDVALLAASSLVDVPNQVASDPESRARILQTVATRLSQSRVSLWSSAANGFGANHSLVPSYVLQSGNPNSSRLTPGVEAKPRQP